MQILEFRENESEKSLGVAGGVIFSRRWMSRTGWEQWEWGGAPRRERIIAGSQQDINQTDSLGWSFGKKMYKRGGGGGTW